MEKISTYCPEDTLHYSNFLETSNVFVCFFLQAIAHGVLAGDIDYVKRLLSGKDKYNINFKNMVSIFIGLCLMR